MTNPIPRFEVKMKYKKEANHKTWSVQFFSWVDAIGFAEDAWTDQVKSVKVKRL